MSYQIESQMMGSDATEEDAEKMVEKLQKLGYDVELAGNCGLINTDYEPLGELENPVPDDVFFSVLGDILKEA